MNGLIFLFFGLILTSVTCFSSDFDSIPEHRVKMVKHSQFTTVATLPKNINEASGLLSYQNGRFWTHNDGGIPVLYEIDTKGNTIKALHLNHRNAGWEDLTKDHQGNLYIGAFGNNNNTNRHLRIIKIKNPQNIDAQVYTGEIINYTYEDQKEFPPPPEKKNFDVDAFIYLNDSLYLFTKNRTTPYNGIINVYSLPSTPGTYVARKVDAFKLPGSKISNWVTGADISEDEKQVALLFHDKVVIIENFRNSKFSQGSFYHIPLNHFSNKGGVCFAEDKIYIVDEVEMNLLGGYLYELTYILK